MHKKKKGYTLLELIISLAILSIIVVTFLTMFTGGFTNIFNMGRKTKTVGEVKAAINNVCQKKDIRAIPDDWKMVDSKDELYIYQDIKPNKYFVEDYRIVSESKTYTYQKLTLVSFYNNGKNYTELTAVIPELKGVARYE